ncbi:hypothetical protein HYDPIDRAFT_114765 [Hydnomerulius pinastri MD-312]|uniref:Uncharacterized protein n=1 Tax=Hydnomerulius pinastri MD-312 TaxID=994086 RepID=A0A0C9V9C2_9AGAM|nr:hypothetical protein HYDPIDRAFT_114765 [Hydnomerulius pinastri MD-312]
MRSLGIFPLWPSVARISKRLCMCMWILATGEESESSPRLHPTVIDIDIAPVAWRTEKTRTYLASNAGVKRVALFAHIFISLVKRGSCLTLVYAMQNIRSLFVSCTDKSPDQLGTSESTPYRSSPLEKC